VSLKLRPCFETPEARVRLKAELDRWVGTPYKHAVGAPGRGADCIHLVVGVLEAAWPLSPRPKIPAYPPDWHLHTSEERLLNFVLEQFPVAPVDLEAPMDGDVILFRFGRALSHAGIYCGGRVYHSVCGARVAAMSWKDQTWAKRRRAAFRMVTS
jgi:NlpC/P60 family putative phage cell wall peptidase